MLDLLLAVHDYVSRQKEYTPIENLPDHHY